MGTTTQPPPRSRLPHHIPRYPPKADGPGFRTMADPKPSLVPDSSPFSHYRLTEKGTSSYQSASPQAACTSKGSAPVAPNVTTNEGSGRRSFNEPA